MTIFCFGGVFASFLIDAVPEAASRSEDLPPPFAKLAAAAIAMDFKASRRFIIS
jgi:hypothetical protein